MSDLISNLPFGEERVDLDKSPLEIARILSRPIWRELRTFLAVAKSPSYVQAAEMLGTSAPTVRRDVKRLQDQVGCQLVVSSFSGVVLTGNGRRLAEQIADLDYQLFVLSNNLHSNLGKLAGQVSVSVTSGLAVAIIAPAVPALSARYPHLNLDIKEQPSLVSFEKNQADIMISLSPISRADIQCRQVGVLHLVPVASLRYIERAGRPLSSSRSRHVFLQCNYYLSDRPVWRKWTELVGQGRHTHQCENSLAYYALVKSGAGIGLLGNYALVDTEIVSLDLDVHIPLPIYAICKLDHMNSKVVAAVYNWLIDIFHRNHFFGESLTFPSDTDLDSGLARLLQSIPPNR